MKLILKKPVITEKANMLKEKFSTEKHAFIVEKTATKDEIKAAVEKMFNVEVDAVNTMRYAGKLKSRFTRSAGFSKGRRPAYKKAIVTLKEGQTIDIYANV